MGWLAVWNPGKGSELACCLCHSARRSLHHSELGATGNRLSAASPSSSIRFGVVMLRLCLPKAKRLAVRVSALAPSAPRRSVSSLARPSLPNSDESAQCAKRPVVPASTSPWPPHRRVEPCVMETTSLWPSLMRSNSPFCTIVTWPRAEASRATAESPTSAHSPISPLSRACDALPRTAASKSYLGGSSSNMALKSRPNSTTFGVRTALR
mmetsp:Transcript_1546/g.3852  ORF Transcript_1546/g.3852 Transcript_1546/m.3852 type:complete len:210 (-) Transcript_1546:269-898(-)